MARYRIADMPQPLELQCLQGAQLGPLSGASAMVLADGASEG